MKDQNSLQNNNIPEIDSTIEPFVNSFITIQNVQSQKVIGTIDSKQGRKPDDPQQGSILYSVNMFNMEPITEDSPPYIIFPLDGKVFIIVNKNGPSGNPLSGSRIGIRNASTSGVPSKSQSVQIVAAEDSPGANNYHPVSEKWLISNIQNNTFQITDTLYNYSLISGDKIFGPDVLGYTVDKDSNTYWTFTSVDEFKIPISPSIETLETFPKYKSLTDNLPDETPKRLTGWTKIPCVMIQDHNLLDSTKLSVAPYYVIEKYQYWKKVETVSLAPGESRDVTYTTGTNTTIMNSMDSSTNMTIGKDAGLKFDVSKDKTNLGGTADLKQTITNGLDIKESTTTDTMTESRETNNQRNPFDKQSMIFSVYQRATELRYIRPSQNEYDPDILIDSWTFIDDTKSNTTSFPPQEAISAELNKKRNQSHIKPSSNVYLNF